MAPAAGDRDEHRAHRLGQVQRLRQEQGSLPASGVVDAPFQITNRPLAHPGGSSQLLLRQPGVIAQPPQQSAETALTLLSHRPSSPFAPVRRQLILATRCTRQS
jgi:hypothetical protein